MFARQVPPDGHSLPYDGVHYPGYLPDDVTPRPFQNCIPESFHANNMHANNGYGHHHGDGHYHEYGGLDHHHHEHGHDDEGYLGGYGGQGGYYASKSSKGGKGGKGKGGGGYSSKSKSSKSKSKSKGLYYRNRLLAGRPARAYETRKKGMTGVHKRHGGGGRRRNKPIRAKASNRQGNEEEKETEAPTHEMMFEDAVENMILLNGQNHHPHPHTHPYASLPLCNNLAPIRRTFGPVPTIAPREPTLAPGESPTDNGTDTAPTIVADDGPTDTAADEPAAADPNAPPGTERVLVEAFLEFGFFEDVTAREPSQAEVDAMLARTSQWYTEQLQATFPNLESFEAAFVATETDLAADSPIRVDFDANAFFTTGTEIPSTGDVFIAMEGLNYQDYITNSVWSADQQSGGPFDDIQAAGFNARGGR